MDTSGNQISFNMTSSLIVFYSWQSDLPENTNKDLIADALEKACKALSLELDIPIRSDADIQEQPGAPDIASTLLKKIEEATIFVADVSIIGKATIVGGDATRMTPNPNVMFELGYAKKALGPERVIMICNTAYGHIEDLPFDIRGRVVTQYHYDGMDGPNQARARNELIARLKAVLGLALADVSAGQARRATIRDAQATQENLTRQKDLFEQWRKERLSEILSDPPLPQSLRNSH